MSGTTRPLADRFWERVQKTDSCWLWTAGKTTAGYGKIQVGSGGGVGREQYVHRLSYEFTNGPIPPGMTIDHICHVHACVNPAHLRATTQKQNNENHAGAQSNSRSGVRGVWFDKRKQRWKAEVHSDGARWSRSFRTLEAASAAAVEMRNRMHTHNDRDRTGALS